MSLIEFSEEQGMLLETAMDFCANKAPMAAVRALMETETGFDAAVWKEMADLGWLGIVIPENYGGLGMGLACAVPVAEAMGKFLMPSPFVSTTIAAQALVGGGSEEQKSTWLPRIAGGSIVTCAVVEPEGDWDLANISSRGTRKDDKLRLEGTKSFVLDAGVAEAIIVSVMVDGSPALVLLESGEIPADHLVRETVIDETRRSWQLTLDGIAVNTGRILPVACLATIENAAMLMQCAEMTGGIAGVLHVVVEYLKTRKQFDRYIGSYQALKHPTVDILIGHEAARSHLYHAATAVAGDDPREIETAIRMAKARTSEAFAFAGDRAIQFHGGFGFTWECDAQLYLRRALWCQYQFGDERHQRQLLTPLLLDADLAETGLAAG